MFVHDFVHVARPAHEVQEQILANHGRFLRPLSVSAPDTGDIRVLVGPPGPAEWAALRKRVQVELGEPHLRGATVVVPIQWTATGAPYLFPSLDADLEVSPLGANETRVALSGRYNPPLGSLGRTLDDLWLHGLAEDTLRTFLRRLATAIEEPHPTEVVR